MQVFDQAPQPVIKCYSSERNGKYNCFCYQIFSPNSVYTSGKNLQSYTYSKDIDNIAGSFSFTIVEDVKRISNNVLFMDDVSPLDVITISEGGDGIIDFIGVITTVSVGAMSSNLTKQVTVSGKSIEYLFEYLNINGDLKSVFINNTKENNVIKIDFASKNGNSPTTIKDIALAGYKIFERNVFKYFGVSNTIVANMITQWFGNPNEFLDADEDEFLYPIASNMFEGEKVTYIDYIRKLLPSPVYEVFGYIDSENHPKLRIRKAPFSKKELKAVKIPPVLITNFTLTRTCEEMYTGFMPYVEGSAQSPSFYLNLSVAESEKTGGYNIKAAVNEQKVQKYGLQILTCSFIGFNKGTKGLQTEKLANLATELRNWYTDLDDMLNGDLSVVNNIKNREDIRSFLRLYDNLNEENQKDLEEYKTKLPSLVGATIGNWLKFSGGCFYIQAENHSWNYGNNPVINFTLGRGGDYESGSFKRLTKVSAAYKELE